jgi:hypothetical protein
MLVEVQPNGLPAGPTNSRCWHEAEKGSHIIPIAPVPRSFRPTIRLSPYYPLPPAHSS